MKRKIADIWGRIFYRVPAEYAADFRYDSLERNIRRFSLLPFFNIVTQLSCIFIYLYVYPMVYPDRAQINPTVYLVYSAVYCIVNVAAAALFIPMRQPARLKQYTRLATAAVYIYIMCYVVLESGQVSIEFEISGNIYRFLATFFVVSFFPVVGRLARTVYMTAYILIAELSLQYLHSIGVNIYSYAEINLIVYLVCLVAANVYYNGVIRTFVLRKRLEFLSMKDELTRLANRRSMNQYLQQSWKTALRSGGTIGVLMIDIDRFKRYNDTYGHQAGDDCLARVARAIEGCFSRSIDLCARYGGEEFVVVLAHATGEGALLQGEKVRRAVEELAIPHGGNPPYGCVTCSVGVVVAQPRLGQNAELVLHQADDALYAAKNAGRNRVRLYDADGPGQA